MPSFGRTSKQKLDTCDTRLQDICNEAVKIMDCSVICGHRSEEEQNAAFERGASKLKYPQSKHNKTPSLAVDIIPYPVDWSDYNRFTMLAGIITGIAHIKGIKIRWGGDFNMDFDLKNDRFKDLPHFEIIE